MPPVEDSALDMAGIPPAPEILGTAGSLLSTGSGTGRTKSENGHQLQPAAAQRPVAEAERMHPLLVSAQLHAGQLLTEHAGVIVHNVQSPSSAPRVELDCKPACQAAMEQPEQQRSSQHDSQRGSHSESQRGSQQSSHPASQPGSQQAEQPAEAPENEAAGEETAEEAAAEALAAATRLEGGSRVVTELYEYMNLLGIQGIGLVEATQRCPLIGELIGAQLYAALMLASQTVQLWLQHMTSLLACLRDSISHQQPSYAAEHGQAADSSSEGKAAPPPGC